MKKKIALALAMAVTAAGTGFVWAQDKGAVTPGGNDTPAVTTTPAGDAAPTVATTPTAEKGKGHHHKKDGSGTPTPSGN